MPCICTSHISLQELLTQSAMVIYGLELGLCVLRFTSQCTMAHKPKLSYPCTYINMHPYMHTYSFPDREISLVNFVHSVKKQIKVEEVLGYLS